MIKKIICNVLAVFLCIVCFSCGSSSSSVDSEVDYSSYFNMETIDFLASLTDNGYILSLSSEPDNVMSKVRTTYYFSANKIELYLLVRNCYSTLFTPRFKFFLNYSDKDIVFNGSLENSVTMQLLPDEQKIIKLTVDGLQSGVSYDFLIINSFVSDNYSEIHTYRYVLTEKDRAYSFPEIIYENVGSDILNPDLSNNYTEYRFAHAENGTNTALFMLNNMNTDINYIVLTMQGLNKISENRIVLDKFTEYKLNLDTFEQKHIWSIAVENPFVPLEDGGVLRQIPANASVSLPN
ncbi:hypothetical protein EP073_06645 [Geovibrio thiophilus]|uniref:DUF4249 family protein n=1 Tax=Geovibrio thiophilus TaxID=139438 RepID=A0A410JY63_9BACT|nr:hypothetical protein [Geovibrio thiophilus]QAR33092.1 hypothetical protein EP073_06645 [Geovibrio thiophilus]